MTHFGRDLITSLKQAATLERRRRKRAVTSGLPLVEADAVALRAQAAEQSDPRLAKRLRLIAQLAEGLGILDAAARERVNETTVRRWRGLYARGGVAALLREPMGRRPRLTKKQSAALAAMVRQNPRMTYLELCALVKRRFHVAYTPSGLEAFITRELGFMRHDGCFFGGRSA